MSSIDDFLASLVEPIGEALVPLAGSLQSSGNFSDFLQAHGWDVPAANFTITDIQGLFTCYADLSQVEQLLDKVYSNDPAKDHAYVSIIAALGEALSDLDKLSSPGYSPPNTLPAPFNTSGFWSDFAGNLRKGIIANYLKSNQPLIFALLVALGIADIEFVSAGGATGRIDFAKSTLSWSGVVNFLSNPVDSVKNAYGWGSPNFDPDALLYRLASILVSLGAPVRFQNPSQNELDSFFDPANPVRNTIREAIVPLVQGVDDSGNSYELDFTFLPIPQKGGTGNPIGIALGPSVSGTIPEISMGNLKFTLEGDFSGGLYLIMRPGEVDLKSDVGATSLSAGVSLALGPPDPIVLVGTPDSMHLEISGLKIGVSAGGSLGNLEVKSELAATSGKLVLDFSGSDSFLSEIIGASNSTIDFQQLGVIWSSKTGIHFEGAAQLELDIPVRKSIGIINIDTISILLGPSGGGLKLGLGASGSASLGPLNVSVDKVGMELLITPSSPNQQGPTLGNLAVNLGFMPPRGLGISLDAGVVSGGGYISFDPDKREYAGALQLEAAGIGLDAYGVLDTILPGGQKGYSLVLVVHAHFDDPGIEVGMGVTITGVGGMVGINRTMLIQVLEDDVRNHTIQDLMFPTDPVKDAPEIISGLNKLFPPDLNEFVFGPMAQLQWGEGGMVVANIGVFLELVKAPKIVMLGNLSLNLPDPDAPLVSINLDVDGFIDFQAKSLGIDATIYDSYIISPSFSISGDMALRAGWGDNPIFLFSIGGYHPKFQPPAGFPTLNRMQVSFSPSDDIKIGLQAYNAVTSNTFQMGAKLFVYAEVSGFYAKGDLGFDALIIFKPFSFEIDFVADVAIGKTDSSPFLSASLQGSLNGFSPLVVDGTASFSILFFSASVTFHKVLADGQPPSAPPPVDPRHVEDLLSKALAAVENWSGGKAQGALNVVSLNQGQVPDGTIVLDPVGTLTVKQNKVPLDKLISAYAGVALGSPTTFSIGGVAVAGSHGGAPHNLNASEYGPSTDEIAPSLYKIMSDDEKLSAPSFEPLHAGVEINPDYIGTSGKGTEVPASYETRYVDTLGVPSTILGKYIPSSAVFLARIGSGTLAASAMMNSGPRKFASGEGSVSVASEGYAVASKDDLSSLGMSQGVASMTYSQALDQMNAYVAKNPGSAGKVQIVLADQVAQ